jgi:hypothetical protein
MPGDGAAGGFAIREATPEDDGVVAAMMTEYLSWAVVRLHEEYGVEWPPIVEAEVRTGLVAMRRPDAVLLIAERSAEPVGVGAVRRLAPQRPR